MKNFAAFCAAAALILFAATVARTQATQNVIPGTQVRVTLLDRLEHARGAQWRPVHGHRGGAGFLRQHHFVAGRSQDSRHDYNGGASAMDVHVPRRRFDEPGFQLGGSREPDLPRSDEHSSIYQSRADASKTRKDLSTVEGVVVEERHDVRTDVEDIAIGTAGGSVAGVVFSRVLRGTIIGLVGGSAYVIAKKGKDVELPAQTGLLVRMDSNVSVPASLLHNAVYSPGTGE